MNRFSTPRTISLVVCLSLLFSTISVAQDDPDLKLLDNYQLTVANVGKVKAALDKAKELKYETPAKEEGESFDALTRKLEQHSEWGAILRTTSIGAKDFVMTLATVTAVALATSVSGDESGKNLPTALRDHHKFMVENQEAVKPLVETIFGDTQ